MVDLVASETYTEQLKALLPQGRAWPRERDSVLSKLLGAEAEGLSDIDRTLTALLSDIRPATTTGLLPDWERVLGLPDDCSEEAGTLQQRRAAVLDKVAAMLCLTPQAFIDLGRTFGAVITVVEHDQTLADAIAGLDTSDGKWRFVWWVTIDAGADTRYFDTLSDVNTPLVDIDRITELECRLQKASPAHTHLVVGYAAVS